MSGKRNLNVLKELPSILTGLNRFMRNPFAAFIFLTIAVAVFAYLSDRLNEQEGYCTEGRIDLIDQEAAIRSGETYAINLKIFDRVIEMGNGASSEQHDAIRKSIKGVEHDLREQAASVGGFRKELNALCEKISHDRRQAYLIYLMVSALFAAYGFWAGVQLSRKENNA